MIAENVKNSNIGVGVGIGLQILGRVLMATAGQQSPLIWVGLAVAVVGSVAFVWGCCQYAVGKGYSAALGLLGICSCLGLLVLILMPDKNKDGGPPPPGGPQYGPPQSGTWPPPPST